MSVTLLPFEGCPGWREAEGRLRQALRAGRPGEGQSLELVDTPEDAERLRSRGSPR